MTHEHFIEALEEEMRRRRIQFKRTDVEAFVKHHWPGIVKDPDLAKWAREFLDSGHGTVTV
jgi:hypothetical protein